MPTTKPRITITLDEETTDKLYLLRGTKEFCRCSISEVVRRLLAEQFRGKEKEMPE